MANETLDATGLKCPLPVLKAQKRLKNMAAGERLAIMATDPGAPADLKALCDTRGHVFVSEEEVGGTFTVVVERNA